jgi:hypothetical protein
VPAPGALTDALGRQDSLQRCRLGTVAQSLNESNGEAFAAYAN